MFNELFEHVERRLTEDDESIVLIRPKEYVENHSDYDPYETSDLAVSSNAALVARKMYDIVSDDDTKEYLKSIISHLLQDPEVEDYESNVGALLDVAKESGITITIKPIKLKDVDGTIFSDDMYTHEQYEKDDFSTPLPDFLTAQSKTRRQDLANSNVKYYPVKAKSAAGQVANMTAKIEPGLTYSEIVKALGDPEVSKSIDDDLMYRTQWIGKTKRSVVWVYERLYDYRLFDLAPGRDEDDIKYKYGDQPEFKPVEDVTEWYIDYNNEASYRNNYPDYLLAFINKKLGTDYKIVDYKYKYQSPLYPNASDDAKRAITDED